MGQQIEPGVWKHWKGVTYVVLFTAIHTETEQEMVIYHREDDPDTHFARPASQWFEETESGLTRFHRMGREAE